MDNKSIALELYDIGAIQVGEFVLASGLTSQVYFDIRRVVSHPKLLKKIAEEMWAKLEGSCADLICGVPYTALPIATHISIRQDLPMVMVRKEPKKYGTKKQVEGVFEKGQTCYIIEDLVTTGGSVINTVAVLEAEGIEVRDVAVLIDRQQGGNQNLVSHDIRLHAVMTVTELFDFLREENRLNDMEERLVTQFFKTLETTA